MSEQIPTGAERQPDEDMRAYLARKALESVAHQAHVLDQVSNALSDAAAGAEAQRDVHRAELAELPPQDQDTLGPLWPGR